MFPAFPAQELEDWFAEVIGDSLGPCWTPRDAAKHIILNLADALESHALNKKQEAA